MKQEDIEFIVNDIGILQKYLLAKKKKKKKKKNFK